VLDWTLEFAFISTPTAMNSESSIFNLKLITVKKFTKLFFKIIEATSLQISYLKVKTKIQLP